jgi:hypothetical protein
LFTPHQIKLGVPVKQIKVFTMTYFLTLLFLATGCSQYQDSSTQQPGPQSDQLYSTAGKEYKARFEAVYNTRYRRIEDLQPGYLIDPIRQTTKFLFGPLTYRSLGGVQKGEKIIPHPELATLQNGRVVLPYSYEAVWMVHSEKVLASGLSLPLPYSASDILNTNWMTCTDSADEDHATPSFLWYFWDPTRPGCVNQEGTDYQTVQIHFDQETEQTVKTFPEYDRMIHNVNGRPVLAMTFAFGYVEDAARPRPFKDSDAGMREFQKFYNIVQRTLSPLGFKEEAILQSEYTSGSEKIGSRFVGKINNVEYQVSVVANASVDQMDLFAKSFANRHEGFFGWFGHSRVGDGFDADQFRYKLSDYPQKFSLSKDYQLVYWAGCNSYSYYTLPFFDMKAKLDSANDPKGTRNLDIISNTLPSLFAFNANNANVLFEALINQQQKTSYQSIVDKIENSAQRYGYDVLVNVLGDEDNK